MGRAKSFFHGKLFMILVTVSITLLICLPPLRLAALVTSYGLQEVITFSSWTTGGGSARPAIFGCSFAVARHFVRQWKAKRQ